VGKSGEFFTFDETLAILSINELKLKRLVSEGELRAFRIGDQMVFRRADVENIKLRMLPSRDQPEELYIAEVRHSGSDEVCVLLAKRTSKAWVRWMVGIWPSGECPFDPNTKRPREAFSLSDIAKLDGVLKSIKMERASTRWQKSVKMRSAWMEETNPGHLMAGDFMGGIHFSGPMDQGIYTHKIPIAQQLEEHFKKVSPIVDSPYDYSLMDDTSNP
jgi:hypothetical protein